MPTGFQVYGAGGQFQIDGNTSTLHLRNKGTVTCTSHSTGYRGVYTYTGGVNPVMAFYSTAVIACINAPQSGSTYTFEFYSQVNNAQAEVFIFDAAELFPMASGVGMEMWDENGRLIFTSSASPMRVVTPNVSVNPATSGQVYNVGGTKPGVVLHVPAFYAIPGGDQAFVRTLSGLRQDGGGVIRSFPVPVGEFIPSPGPQYNGLMSIVELAGL